MSNEILNAIKDGVRNVKSDLQDEIANLREEVTAEACRRQTPSIGAKGSTSIGEQFVKSKDFANLASGDAKHASKRFDIGVKAMVTNGQGDSNDDPVDLQGARDTTSIGNWTTFPTSVAQLLPIRSFGQNSFSFHQWNALTNSVDAQESEGAEKAEASYDLPVTTVNISTYAAWIEMSNQLIADAGYVATAIDARLRQDMAEKVDSALLNDDGTAGTVNGLLNQATSPSLQAGTDWVDRIGSAIDTQLTNGYEASAVIVHINDWGQMLRQKGTDGHYRVNDWATPSPPSVWGVPVVATRNMTEGSALVVDTRQLVLLERQGTVVEMGYRNDNFSRNLVTLRAESRFGLAVFSPASLLLFDLAQS